MRARLLLAFAAITALAVLSAAAALHAFREVGGRLELVERRAPITLAALELSRSAERVIAAAPALLATTGPRRRAALEAELAAELETLDEALHALRAGGAPTRTLESAVAALGESLAALDDIVTRRLASAERIARARGEVFRINAEVQRLLAPWLAIVDAEIAALVGEVPRLRSGTSGDEAGSLASALRRQRLVQRAQRRFSAAVDTLNEISVAERAKQVTILDFRLGLALRDLATVAAGLDPRLRSLFLEPVARLGELATGARSIADARTRELRLLADGERRLAETTELSARFGAALDRLGAGAKRDIGEAIGAALGVQRASARTLVTLVALSFAGSALIVWLYVGRRVVRRLDTLGEAMLAIAAGDVGQPVDTRGGDEIAALGHAVETLRRNTAERDDLLLRQAREAERLEREVDIRTAELARANAFKTRFLAAASHDLRQPLHALNLFVAQLRDTSERTGREPLIVRIDAALASMNELFDALLDMSRLEAGVLEPAPSDFPMARLLARLETTFADAAREKGLELRVVPSRVRVRSDVVLLERIALNLVANAVRHTERGGVVVGCRRRRGRLWLDVRDSGPGIALDRQREIFGEFRQLVPHRPGNSAGLGLGLAIVDGLARLLGHDLELDSSPGRGSRFSVSLPRATSAEDAGGEPTLEGSARDGLVIDPLPGTLIVVVDDDEPVREGMRGTLERWGCAVVTAPTAEVAVARLAAHGTPPDLIVADCHLGDARTGIDAIARVRAAARPDLPAFLISGDTAPERRCEASASGLHLVHKPIAPIKLRAMLNRLLG